MTITRTDGVVIYATSHDQDLTIDGNVYLSRAGGTPTDVASQMALNVDNADLHGLLDLASISEDDLKAGVYDYAAVSKFLVNYADLTQGRYRQQDGTLGQVTVDRLTFVAELRGLMQALQESFGRVCTPSCSVHAGRRRLHQGPHRVHRDRHARQRLGRSAHAQRFGAHRAGTGGGDRRPIPASPAISTTA